VKTSPYSVVILVGVGTAIYTAYGGLLISIITDQLQGIVTMVLFSVLTIFLAVAFPRASSLPPFPWETLGFTSTGAATLVTLPLAMVTATFFSEASWQRVWAAESKEALHKGAIASCCMVILVIAVFGLCGLFSAWAYSPEMNDQSANLFLFYALGEYQYSWIGVIVIVLAATMNQSAVDSLQNALTATFTSNLFRERSITFTRGVVFCINIPLMLLGFFGLPALNLFMVANLVTTCTFIPLLAGLWDSGRNYISGYTLMFSSLMSMLAVTVYGALWCAPTAESSVLDGIAFVWWLNNYELKVFVIAFFASIVFLLLFVVVSCLLFKFAGVQGQVYSAEMRLVLDRMHNDSHESQGNLEGNSRTASSTSTTPLAK
jgi:Na+/proline symporter